MPKPDPAKLAMWSDEQIIDYWIEALLERFPWSASDDVYIAQFPEPLRDAYAAWLVWMEVGNGGFEQFFFNRGAGAARAAIDGFTRMQCAHSEKIMRDALEQYHATQGRYEDARTNAVLKRVAGEGNDAWTDFAALYKDKMFGDFVEHWTVIETEFNEKWPAFVREHAALLQR